jgi:hypothetical protein
MLSDEEEGNGSPARAIRPVASAEFTQSIRSPSLLSLSSLTSEQPAAKRNNTARALFRGNGSGAKNVTQRSSRAGKGGPALSAFYKSGKPAGSAAASGANSDSAGSLFEPKPGYLKGAQVYTKN